ncbi:MAG: flagellar basal-body rod protein FlgF [Chitinivibrionales bacterium]|nr:flagellar basal-body rod protein FlgF [Chitinivibrionales bacterium]
MIQGIYLATQGMTTLMQKQDQIANNLANVNTTGYKQSHLFAQTYNKFVKNDQREPFVNRQIKADQVAVDYSEGSLKKTGNPLDFAIKGSGFYTVMTPHGMGFSRNGNFAMDAQGYLITKEGYKVMSTEGFINLEHNKDVRVTSDGYVMQGDERKARLRITDFRKPYRLLRQGNSIYRPQMPDNPAIASPGFAVKQGYLESSNVNLIRNMTEMIAAFRNFEADQKALHAQNETLDKAVNQVGRLS